MANTRRVQPWWLSDMTETCPACSQSYAYHTEIRCIDCDAPMCPICVQVTSKLELACGDCVECDDQRGQGSGLKSEASK